jgi:hypothetical protein
MVSAIGAAARKHRRPTANNKAALDEAFSQKNLPTKKLIEKFD